MITHQFSRYVLIPADPKHLDLARAWTLADPDHAAQRVRPEFWIEQGERWEAWLLTDEEGPVYFFKAVRYDPDIEVHIQFPPYPAVAAITSQIHHRNRLSMALVEGMRWLERRARGVREIRFESQNPSLIRFAEKHLGFTNEGGRLSKRLEAADVRCN
jgi:hypothetical protein